MDARLLELEGADLLGDGRGVFGDRFLERA